MWSLVWSVHTSPIAGLQTVNAEVDGSSRNRRFSIPGDASVLCLMPGTARGGQRTGRMGSARRPTRRAGPQRGRW